MDAGLRTSDSVAPLAGAWIETRVDRNRRRAASIGRPPRGGVDRNRVCVGLVLPFVGRPPRGGVDRNSRIRVRHGDVARCAHGRPPRGGVDRNNGTGHPVAPLAGAWIETLPVADLRAGNVAPLAGAWIETPARPRHPREPTVAPLAGAWIETTIAPNSREIIRVAPLAGAWIETTPSAGTRMPMPCRPPRGGVDRNSTSTVIARSARVAPLAGAWIETEW